MLLLLKLLLVFGNGVFVLMFIFFFICADFKEVLMEPSLLSRSQSDCRGWPNFGGLFDAATSNI